MQPDRLLFILTVLFAIWILDVCAGIFFDKHVRIEAEKRKAVEAQVELEKSKELNLRLQNEIEKNKLRTTRVQNMTGEQVMEYEKMQVIRKACKGDTRCVLSNL